MADDEADLDHRQGGVASDGAHRWRRVYHRRQAGRPCGASRSWSQPGEAALRRAAAHAAGAARESGGARGAGAGRNSDSIAPGRASCSGCSPMRASPPAPASTCSTASSASCRRSASRTALLRWDMPLPQGATPTRAAHPRRRANAHHQPLLESRAAQLARGTLCGGRRPRRAAPRHARDPLRRHAARLSGRRGGDRARRARAVINQIGRDTLPQLLALLARATALPDPGLRSRAHGHHGGHAGGRAVRRDQSRAQRSVSLAQLVRRCLRRRPPVSSAAVQPEELALDREDRGARRDGPHRGATQVTAKLDELLRSRHERHTHTGLRPASCSTRSPSCASRRPA